MEDITKEKKRRELGDTRSFIDNLCAELQKLPDLPANLRLNFNNLDSLTDELNKGKKKSGRNTNRSKAAKAQPVPVHLS